MSKNIHSALIEKYSKDWMETDSPWERWQFRRRGQELASDLVGHPSWVSDVEYIRKPDETKIKIKVNGHDVHAPVSRRPAVGDMYFVPSLSSGHLRKVRFWDSTAEDVELLNCGMIFMNEGHAKQYALALLDHKDKKHNDISHYHRLESSK